MAKEGVIQHAESWLDEIKQQLGGDWKKIIVYAIGAVIAFLILVPLLTYAYFAHDISSKQSIMNLKNDGVVLLDRNGQPFFTFYQTHSNDIIPLDQIPKYTQEAIISSEDKNFYQEPGFSIRGIGRAVVTDLQKQSLAQGGSTITQQLVKNALLSSNKNFLRKFQEVVLAIELTRRFSKNDILEMYLNTIYLGEGAYGIQDGAKAYFSKNASQLDLAESALLAGILPAPSAFSPLSGNRSIAFTKQKEVLQKMYEQGYITATQRDQAEQEKIVFHPQNQTVNIHAPQFALMVKDQLLKQYSEQDLAHSGFTVQTTLDLPGQEYAQQIVANQVQNLAGDHVSNGAAVVMDPTTGEILALVGSHDWNDPNNGKINMALSPRQPGSSFKPIIYSYALEHQLITPATILQDVKTTFPGNYTPHDYDYKYRGNVTVRFALANSLNIPAVEVMQMVGVPQGVAFAKQLGITTLKDPSSYGLAFVLGAANVPLLEMTDVYATFANQGTQVKPTTIIKITDKQNNTVYSYTPQSQQVLSPQTAFLISSILSDNKTRSYEFGNTLTINRPAAVKTGTTDDFRDALTLGYTPQIVVGAWVGNNDNSPMDSIAGSLGAAPIWRQLMEHFLLGDPVETFQPPQGVIQAEVCLSSTNSATISAYPEFFLQGTQPQSCAVPTATPSAALSPTESPTPTPSNNHPASPTPTPTPIPPNQPLLTPTPTPISQQFIFPTSIFPPQSTPTPTP